MQCFNFNSSFRILIKCFGSFFASSPNLTPPVFSFPPLMALRTLVLEEVVVEDRSAGKNFLCHLTQDCFIIRTKLCIHRPPQQSPYQHLRHQRLIAIDPPLSMSLSSPSIFLQFSRPVPGSSSPRISSWNKHLSSWLQIDMMAIQVVTIMIMTFMSAWSSFINTKN